MERVHHTKLGACQDPFVEQDDTGAEADPQGDVEGRVKAASGAGRGLRGLGSSGLEFPVLFVRGGAFLCHGVAWRVSCVAGANGRWEGTAASR